MLGSNYRIGEGMKRPLKLLQRRNAAQNAVEATDYLVGNRWKHRLLFIVLKKICGSGRDAEEILNDFLYRISICARLILMYAR